MKANRNQKINRICRKLYSKYRKNVISLVTAAVLLVTSMPLADISGVVSKMVSTVTNAITAMAADTYTDITNDIKMAFIPYRMQTILKSFLMQILLTIRKSQYCFQTTNLSLRLLILQE